MDSTLTQGFPMKISRGRLGENPDLTHLLDPLFLLDPFRCSNSNIDAAMEGI